MNRREIIIYFLNSSLMKCARVMHELGLEAVPFVYHEDRLATLIGLIDSDRLDDLEKAIIAVERQYQSTVDKREG